jgi:hypothetical protein
MADPKKGFDPLASLFDGPDLRDFEGAPLPEIDDYDVPFEAQPEHTDPLISMQVDGVPLARLESGETHAPAPNAPMPSRALDAPDPGHFPSEGVDEVPLVAPTQADPLPSAFDDEPLPTELSEPVEEPPVEEPARPQVDKAALAKALARAAMAKAAAAAPKETASETRKAHGVKTAGLRKAQQAQARRIPPPPEDEEASAPPAKKKKGRPTSKSRVAGLAARARRPKSALEAAREAAKAEDAKAEEAQVARLLELPLRVQGILRRQLTGMSKVEVANALVMSDRPLLRALWKGHRARFVGSGQLSEVVATTNVIRALGAVPAGQLVAAIVETTESEYLVWVDVGSEAVIAAFPDARAWYASSRS